MSSGLVERTCAVVITTTSRRQYQTLIIMFPIAVITAKNTVISPNILLRKFFEMAEFPHSFGKSSDGNCAFPKHFHTRKLGGITLAEYTQCITSTDILFLKVSQLGATDHFQQNKRTKRRGNKISYISEDYNTCLDDHLHIFMAKLLLKFSISFYLNIEFNFNDITLQVAKLLLLSFLFLISLCVTDKITD